MAAHTQQRAPRQRTLSPEPSEYGDRLRRLRDFMAADGVDYLLVYGQKWRNGFIRYLCGYEPAGTHLASKTLLIVPVDRETTLCVTPGREEERAKTVSVTESIIAYKDFSRDCARIVRDACKKRARFGFAGDFGKPYAGMPHNFITSLYQSIPGLELVNFTSKIDSMRIIKSSSEIEIYRRGAKAARGGWEAILKHLGAGVSENELWAWHWNAMESAGADDTHSVLVRGRDGMMWIRPPSDARIQLGEVVGWEITPKVSGYYFQINRIAGVGGELRRYREVFDVIREAINSAINMVRPGANSAGVAKAAIDSLEGSSIVTTLKYFRVGHGTGTSLDENPYIHFNTDVTLQENMVFVLHPVAYIPQWKGSVQSLGDMVRVTSRGVERLSQVEEELPEV